MPIAAAIPYIATAATLAGTGLSIASQQKAKSAMSKVRSDYAQQQSDLQRRATPIYEKNRLASSPESVNAQLAKGAAERGALVDALQQSSQPIASALPATDDANSRRTATAGNAWRNLVTGAGNELGSYGDWNTNQNVGNIDTNSKLGVINNEAQANARLFPTELGVASEKGDKLSGWGQLVSSLGTIAGMSAAVKAPATAGTWGANDSWTTSMGNNLGGKVAKTFSTPSETTDWLNSFSPTPVK